MGINSSVTSAIAGVFPLKSGRLHCCMTATDVQPPADMQTRHECEADDCSVVCKLEKFDRGVFCIAVRKGRSSDGAGVRRAFPQPHEQLKSSLLL